MTRVLSRRALRAGTVAAAAALAAFVLMGRAGHLRWGVPLGTALVVVAAFALAYAFATPGDTQEVPARIVSAFELGTPLLTVASALLALLGGLAAAQAGVALPQGVWGLVIAAACAALAVRVFALGQRLGAFADVVTRPWWRRHGFWLVAIACALYLPRLGMSSLWDPWETHYGEVAREMLSRDDWISTWWANEGFFYSKPALDMWLQALAMAALGVHYQPDKMLIGDGTAPTMHPEWVVRAPVVLLSIFAVYILYKGVAQSCGRRAAMLGPLVLTTSPLWLFIAHQTMTDMPFVGTMVACMGLTLLGLATSPDRQAPVVELRLGSHRLRLSAQHLVLGFVALCILPQALYLASRNVEFLWEPGARGFRLHWDEFWSGSGGGINCGLPGSENCHSMSPALVNPALNAGTMGGSLRRAVGAFEPVLQALLWLAILTAILWANRHERRLRRLYYLAAWCFAGLSTLAKGPGGFALPMLVVFVTICSAGPDYDVVARIQNVIRELSHAKIVTGILVVVAVAIPWYVAMYVRHGTPFTDRLIFHDMLGRVRERIEDKGVSDDWSFRYYIGQLGYAMFPWTALVPLGLAYPYGRAGQQDRTRSQALLLLSLWCLCSFALFSFMGTKYYYYILPAVPPAAMLVGVVLDGMLESRQASSEHESRMVAIGAILGALLLALVVRDVTTGDESPQRPAPIRFLQLFTYNYDRPWPDELHFAVPIAVFGIVAASLFACLAASRLRRLAVGGGCMVAVVWATWCIDVYMAKLAPHWGQRELIAAYYADRSSPKELLVAYQMNWKGENFYTGNHIPIFVSTGNAFTSWLAKERDSGARVMYFITEHGRLGGLKHEVGAKSYRELTDRALCNKFVVVRAEF